MVLLHISMVLEIIVYFGDKEVIQLYWTAKKNDN